MPGDFVQGQQGAGLGGKAVAFGDGGLSMFANLVLPTALLQSILDAIKTAATGQLDAVVVRLYKNDMTPIKSTVIGDFTEADFDGYAASSAVTWGAAVIGSQGWPESIGSSKLFTATGSTTPNTLYGYYMTDAAGAVYKGGARFPAVINIANSGDFAHVTPVFDVGNLTGT